MSQPERCDFGGEDKVKVLGMHLMEGKAVSALCEEHKINPSLFYQWQRTFFENGSRAFDGTGTPKAETRFERQIEALESKLQRKNEVLSELMEEHIRLKKDLGEI